MADADSSSLHGPPAIHSGKRMLSDEHAGQDCIVAALDARHVDDAGRASHQRAARESELRWDSKPPSMMARAP